MRTGLWAQRVLSPKMVIRPLLVAPTENSHSKTAVCSADATSQLCEPVWHVSVYPARSDVLHYLVGDVKRSRVVKFLVKNTGDWHLQDDFKTSDTMSVLQVKLGIARFIQTAGFVQNTLCKTVRHEKKQSSAHC